MRVRFHNLELIRRTQSGFLHIYTGRPQFVTYGWLGILTPPSTLVIFYLLKTNNSKFRCGAISFLKETPPQWNLNRHRQNTHKQSRVTTIHLQPCMHRIHAAHADWDQARTPDHARNLVDCITTLSSELARSESARSACSSTDLWPWAMEIVRSWMNFEMHVDSQKREERAYQADIVRAVLGLLRNSAQSSEHALQACIFVPTLTDLCNMCLVYERMSDPICT